MATSTKSFNASDSWTCPPGVYSIQVEAWGGGGSGGGASVNNDGGGGGAGGQYAKTNSVTVVPGTTYTVVVGGTNAGTTGNGTQGNQSYFTTTGVAPTTVAQGVLAKGGNGGTANNGAGGAGNTTGAIGDTSFRGGNGSAGAASTRSGGGGGGAGSGGAGGDTTASTTAGTGTATGGGNGGAGLAAASNAAGNPGSTAGGGGGGAYRTTTTSRAGGTGAAGQVIITFTNPAAEQFKDNFDSGAFGHWWNDWGFPQPGIVSGQLSIASSLAANYFGLDSYGDQSGYQYYGVRYDLTGSYVLHQLVNAGNQSITSWEVYPVNLTVDDGVFTTSVSWLITGNNIIARKRISGANTDLSTAAYNSTTMKWFRIRESGGTMFWDYSADGRTWTNQFSVANPITVTSLRCGAEVGTWQAEASTTTGVFDNFNMPPPVAIDVNPGNNTLNAFITQAVNRASRY